MTSAVETEYALDTFARATLAANGAGQHTNIGPTQPGERWEVKFLSASGATRAKLQVVRGNSFNVARQLDVTDRADGDSSNTDIKLQSGESLSFWWTNGVSGAVMTCAISGTRFVKGRRAY